jgi:hypothetical protein
VRLEDFLEAQRVFGQAALGLVVTVIDRQRVLFQVEKRDVGAGFRGALGGNPHQLLVERAGAQATGEGKDFGHGGTPHDHSATASPFVK